MVKVSFYSLTKNEQEVLETLYRSRSALNPWQIYRSLIYCAASANDKCRKLLKMEISGRHVPTEYHALPSYSAMDIALPKDKVGVYTLVKSMKIEGVDVPQYQTIVKMLDSFADRNMIKKREERVGKATRTYYMEEDQRAALKKHIEGN